MVNLEDVIKHEEKVAILLDNMQKNQDLVETFEQWWIISENSITNTLDRLFRDERIKKGIRLSVILEIMGVHLTCFLVSEVKISTRTQAHLKNMMF